MSKAIEEARRMVAERLGQIATGAQYGTVVKVDQAARTCEVAIGGITARGVLLYAVENKELKGLCLIPAVGSTVLVARIGSSNRRYVAMFSEVEKVLLTIGDKVEAGLDAEQLAYQNDRVTLKITGAGVELKADTVKLKADKVEADSDQIVLNGGSFGGLVKVAELQKNLDSLQQYVETMHAALPAAFAAVGAAMAANGALGKTAYDGAMAGKIITIGDMENDKVKH